MHAVRIKKLTQIISQSGLTAVAIIPGPTLTYLTGLHFHLMERPTVLLITADGQAALILPALETGKLAAAPAEITPFTYGDDPGTWPEAFRRAAEHVKLPAGLLGVEPTRMRYLEFGYLRDALSGLTIMDGSSALGELRICKDAYELAKMRRAAEIAQTALLSTLRGLQAGISEKALANELIVQLLRAGSDPELPFPPIVSFGENSANPHAVPTDRALKDGDLLLVDYGASCDGYLSDITRTFTFGQVDPELVQVGKIVLAANQEGHAAGRPGVEAGEVDRAARSVIEAAGFGEAFIHRTGHGLGLEAHEAPYIYDGNSLILRVGMTFTIEPGIYLPGRGGVRIEDDVVVTETGLHSLTDLPREVLPVEATLG